MSKARLVITAVVAEGR